MPSPPVQVVLRAIGANVARLRVRRGLTQEQLAERVGVDLRHLVRVQRGEVGVSIDLLVRVATALEVTPARLLQRSTAPTPRAGRPRTRPR